MLDQPPPQSLLDAMAALGWRAVAVSADAKAEIAALDQAASLRPPSAKRTTIEDIRRRIGRRRDRLAEAPAAPIEMPAADEEFMREAARADEGAEKLQLPSEILERMRRDQEQADREKGGPEA